MNIDIDMNIDHLLPRGIPGEIYVPDVCVYVCVCVCMYACCREVYLARYTCPQVRVATDHVQRAFSPNSNKQYN